MAKVTTKVTLAIADLLSPLGGDKAINEIFKAQLGRAVVDEAKELISSGISPVRTFGRFIGYSESYKQQITGKLGFFTRNGQKIPYEPKAKSAKFANKTTRPVNLELSGRMLSYYTWQRLSGMSIKVGIIAAPPEVQAIAEAHQNGNPANNLPTRRIVPEMPGEEFAVSVQRKIKEVYSGWLAVIVARSNK